eukprot:Nk52_evm20s289 gene=Nk52_evmTU20s289
MNGNVYDDYDDPSCLSPSNPDTDVTNHPSPYNQYANYHSYPNAPPPASVPIATQTGGIHKGDDPVTATMTTETAATATDVQAGPGVITKRKEIDGDNNNNATLKEVPFAANDCFNKNRYNKKKKKKRVIIVAVLIAVLVITGVVVGVVVALSGGGGGGDGAGDGNGGDVTTTTTATGDSTSSTATATISSSFSSASATPTLVGTESDNKVLCWGSNRHKQSNIPDELVHEDVTFVITGQYHTCAAYSLASGGGGLCWGSNGGGQSTVPDMLGRGSNREIIAMAAGDWHTCAIYVDDADSSSSSTAQMKCWGWNKDRQMPSDDDLDAFELNPTLKMPSYPGTISASVNRTCVVDSSGGMHCFGWTSGQLDTPPSSVTKVDTISVGGEGFTCATSISDSALYRWDTSGTSAQTNLNTATQADATDDAFLCAAGNLYTCKLASQSGKDRTVKCTDGIAVPSSLSDVAFRTITPGYRHLCGITEDDSQAFCWGETSDDKTIVPEEMNNASDGSVTSTVVSIAAGRTHTCAVYYSTVWTPTGRIVI